jgi:hypothetical protein
LVTGTLRSWDTDAAELQHLAVLAVPPHVTMEQTKNYLAAILKGDREVRRRLRPCGGHSNRL